MIKSQPVSVAVEARWRNQWAANAGGYLSPKRLSKYLNFNA